MTQFDYIRWRQVVSTVDDSVPPEKVHYFKQTNEPFHLIEIQHRISFACDKAVICRCEKVTRAEIVDACNRSLPCGISCCCRSFATDRPPHLLFGVVRSSVRSFVRCCAVTECSNVVAISSIDQSIDRFGRFCAQTRRRRCASARAPAWATVKVSTVVRFVRCCCLFVCHCQKSKIADDERSTNKHPSTSFLVFFFFFASHLEPKATSARRTCGA